MTTIRMSPEQVMAFLGLDKPQKREPRNLKEFMEDVWAGRVVDPVHINTFPRTMRFAGGYDHVTGDEI